MEYSHNKTVILCNLYHINVSVKFKDKVQSSQTTDGLNINNARIGFKREGGGCQRLRVGKHIL